MFVPWLKVIRESEEVDPEKATRTFPRPSHNADASKTDLLPRAATPSAPSGLSCLLGAAASSPRCLFYPRRHEVTAAAKQAARQGARNLAGSCAPPLNPHSQSPHAMLPHVTGGGWPPRGRSRMGVGSIEAEAGLLQGRRTKRPRESAQTGKGTLELTTSPSRLRGDGSQARIGIGA